MNQFESQFESYFDKLAIVILKFTDRFHQDQLTRSYQIAMEWNNGMEQSDSHVFNAITKLRNNKKQRNENSIYKYILKTVDSLAAEQA